MNNTKIEYCSMTWNPVTGCLHNCPYCYARGIARRIKGEGDLRTVEGLLMDESRIKHYGIKQDENYTLSCPLYRGERPSPLKPFNRRITPYPFGFAPTFHRYRLDEPAAVKEPQTVFVGSMTDLFADYIPDEWIKAVFDACEAAPWHKWLFLTKNPKRYTELAKKGILPKGANYWYGTTATDTNAPIFWSDTHNTFASIEPLMSDFDRIDIGFNCAKWFILGAETGNRKNKVIPKREWIENIVNTARVNGIPVFMKNSLVKIWGEPLIQEYPF